MRAFCSTRRAGRYNKKICAMVSKNIGNCWTRAGMWDLQVAPNGKSMFADLADLWTSSSLQKGTLAWETQGTTGLVYHDGRRTVARYWLIRLSEGSFSSLELIFSRSTLGGGRGPFRPVFRKAWTEVNSSFS